ncbi:MAG: hypothetical protein Crog4KO_17950 [Crocinitomicaceae bacterium]
MRRKQLLIIGFMGAVFYFGSACVNSKSSEINQPIDESTSTEVDSLEQTRAQRLDSAAQIQAQPSVQSNSVTNAQKTVKKKIIND